jgi:hypothetical protein
MELVFQSTSISFCERVLANDQLAQSGMYSATPSRSAQMWRRCRCHGLLLTPQRHKIVNQRGAHFTIMVVGELHVLQLISLSDCISYHQSCELTIRRVRSGKDNNDQHSFRIRDLCAQELQAKVCQLTLARLAVADQQTRQAARQDYRDRDLES